MTAESPDADRDPKVIELDADDVTEVEAKPEAKPASDPPPGRKRGGRSLRLGLGVGLLALAAIAGGWLYRDFLSSYFPSEDMAKLSERAHALEESNAKLRDQVTAQERVTAQLVTDFNTLEGRLTEALSQTASLRDGASAQGMRLEGVEAALNGLTQEIERLKAAPPSAPGGNVVDLTKIAALEQRIVQLEKELASLKEGNAEVPDNSVLSQALSDLKAKVAAGVGYQPEIERLSRLVPAAPGLDVLLQHAPRGLPAAQGLATELRSLAQELAGPVSETPTANDDAWALIWSALSSIITIRMAGEADWPALTTTAAGFAEAGDLTQALAHLAKAEGAKPPAVQQWMDRATARLKVEAALLDVEAAVLRVLKAKGSAP